jgi:hypothetical protein
MFKRAEKLKATVDHLRTFLLTFAVQCDLMPDVTVVFSGTILYEYEHTHTV